MDYNLEHANDPSSPEAPAPGLPPLGVGPDKGTPRSRIVTAIVVTVLYLFLAGSQNLAPYLQPKDPVVGRTPQGGEAAKLILLLDRALDDAGFPTEGRFGAMAASQYAGEDMGPADKLQAVLVLGETRSADAALDWLAAVRNEQDLPALARVLAAGGDWQSQVVRGSPGASWALVQEGEETVLDEEAVADAAAMETLYSQGPAALDDAQTARLRDRYGWLGELALTHGAEPESPARAALFRDISWAVALIVLVTVVVGVGIFGGITMAVVAAVMFFSRQLGRRFVAPLPGGSVYLETFGAFLAGFLVVQVIGTVISGVFGNSPGVRLGALGIQWVLLLTIFWPRVRGVSRPEWREAVGWRAPRGVTREVAAGIAGYFAGIPLLLSAMVFTIVLNFVVAEFLGGSGGPPTNPILELVKNGSALEIVLLLSLATIWAPIVEETVFRGAIYRHLRGRMGAFFAATICAFLFAFMHSYGPLMTAPLIALGFTFAMIREWRGSLIGPVTAHCLHNSVVMTITLVGLRAMM